VYNEGMERPALVDQSVNITTNTEAIMSASEVLAREKHILEKRIAKAFRRIARSRNVAQEQAIAERLSRRLSQIKKVS
jgi:hypothetical protein